MLKTNHSCPVFNLVCCFRQDLELYLISKQLWIIYHMQGTLLDFWWLSCDSHCHHSLSRTLLSWTPVHFGDDFLHETHPDHFKKIANPIPLSWFIPPHVLADHIIYLYIMCVLSPLTLHKLHKDSHFYFVHWCVPSTGKGGRVSGV